jgi:hypothetical protein
MGLSAPALTKNLPRHFGEAVPAGREEGKTPGIRPISPFPWRFTLANRLKPARPPWCWDVSITRENFTLSVKTDKKEKRRAKNDDASLLGFV